MKSDYNEGLQKAIDECKKLYDECVKYQSDCSKCPYFTDECESNCRVFSELMERLEKFKK
jgi:hypothetical protein